jgi:protein XagA
MEKIRKIVVLFFILFSQKVSFAGGGWVPKKGEGFYQVSQRLIAGKYVSNLAAIIGETPKFTFTSTNIYAEYGLGKKFGLILNGSPFVHLTQAGGKVLFDDSKYNGFLTPDKAHGIGDFDLGIKRGFNIGKLAFATTFYFGIPSGNYHAGSTKELHLGHGDWTQKIQVDLSGSFNKFWWTINTSFTNRTIGYSDEMMFGGELGYKHKKLCAILKVGSRLSLYNGVNQETRYPSAFSNNLEYISFAPQLLYYVTPKLGIAGEIAISPYLKNIYAAPSFTVGIFLDIKK